jgi:hypothetical protein
LPPATQNAKPPTVQHAPPVGSHEATHGQLTHPRAGVYVWQVPATQIWLVGQPRPHPPQCRLFFVMSTHPVPLATAHSVKPAVHAVEMHCPCSHRVAPAGQMVVRVPQHRGSDCPSMHRSHELAMPGRQ